MSNTRESQREFASRLRLIADVAESLNEPLTKERLRAFVAERDVSLLPRVWGHIRWKKSLGRPSGTLASGFHVYEMNRGIKVKDFDSPSRWTPLPGDMTLLLWDGPDDETYHRVTIASVWTFGGGVSTIVPKFTRVAWEPQLGGRGLWEFDPPYVMYDSEVLQDDLMLPEFEVRRIALVAVKDTPFLTIKP
jgi:hypothetical protein